MSAPVIVAVVGATATGKSELGLHLAEVLGGEVVNADASQLYRGMDIGTAKLPLSLRHGIPHHQLDVLEVTQEASVATYQRSARADIAAIQSRGRHPVLVGGSGLYLRAALDVLDIPPTDPSVRVRLEGEAEARGVVAMYQRLADVDPVAAQAIEPGNLRRVVRALEVVELTGRPFSATLPRREFVQPTVVIGLRMPRERLDERIAVRVRRMWQDGLVDEVRALERVGLREGRTASRALGYTQALAQLDGSITTEEAQEQTTTLTRRFARRQESWFKPDPRTLWLDALADDLGDRAVTAVRAATEVGAAIGDNGAHG